MKLGDICNILNGRNQKKVEDINGKYPIYGSGGIMGYANDYICKAGTTIIGRKGSINKPLYVDKDFWNVDTAFGLQPKECCNSRFLYYLCKSIDFTRYDKGVTIPSLVKSDLLQIPVSVPPLSEQSRIVEELDQLSNIIEKKRQQLSELDNLAQSIFYDMFILKNEQWERMPLIDIYKFIDYRGKTPNKIDYGVPLITARNIRKGYINYTVKEFISETEFQSRQSRGIAQKGDLLFTTEAPMGYAAIADLDTFSTGQRLITFQQRNEGVVSNIYVLYYILSDMFQTELNKQATGATVKGIKGSKLEKMIVPLPPLNLQQLFAQKIEAIEKEKELIKQSIKETEELFNSRMDYYFG